MAPILSLLALLAAPVQSPFSIAVEGHAVFQSIEFKHVGEGAMSMEADLEILAESVAEALRSDPLVSTEVRYARPHAHHSCGAHKLYVDVWRNAKKWGYSLWSGCSESQRFGWREVLKVGGPMEQLRVVGADLVRALRAADRKGCYTKTC